MSDLTTYTPRADARPDLLDPDVDSWVAAVADVARLAAYIADTAFVPGPLRGNAPAVAATILYGREIGVAPITALQTMHVVNGRVSMAAELQRARVLADGHEIEAVESTAALCRMRGRRRGGERWAEVQWTIGDARAAGLLGNPSWQKYPRAMLVARASAELCRLVFPDITHGMLATEEAETLDVEPASPTAAPATPARKVARAPRTPTGGIEARAGASPASPPPAPEPPREVPAVPRPDAAPPEVPEPPTGEGPTSSPPAPPPDLPEPAVEVVEERGEEHPAPVAVIEADPLVGDEADPRAQGRLKGDGPATRAQTRHVMALLRRLGIGASREERLRVGEALVGRRVSTFTDLTVSDAGRMITTLLIALDSDDPRGMIRYLVDEEQRRLAEAEGES